MTNCKACGAEILFVKMPSGKMNPVDIKPKMLITLSSDGITGMYGKVEKCYESHFATCPKATNFRKKGGKEDEKEKFIAPICLGY